MRDVLLIDIWNRTFRRHCGRELIRAAEYNVYVADDGVKTVQMLRTAAMDAVIVNLSGPEEDETGLVARIARAHPRIDIVFLSASGIDRLLEHQPGYRGLIRYLGEYLRNSELQRGKGPGLRGELQRRDLSDSRLILNQGGII